MRAEDSAATQAERARLHQQRVDSEQERLNAASDADKRERDATRLADERAQQAESAHIRAAEQRANGAAAADAPPDKVLPWNDVVPQKRLAGTLVNVDCSGTNARLEIKDRSGSSIRLLLKDAEAAGLQCGPQKPQRAITLSYSAQPDDRSQTAGQITALKVH